MVSSLRRTLSLSFALSSTLLFAAASASAQHVSDSVSTGTAGFSTTTQVVSALKAQGIYLGAWGSNVTGSANAVNGFKIIFGTLDESTGQGEIGMAGDLQWNTGALALDMRNLTYTSNATGQFVTAGVFLNGVYQGRQVIMNISSSNPFTSVQKGTVQSSSNVYYTYDPAFVKEFVNFFQTPQLTSVLQSAPIGFFTFSMTLVQAPLSRN